MSYLDRNRTGERVGSSAAVLAVLTLGIAAVLLMPRFAPVPQADDAIAVIAIADPPPPPPVPEPAKTPEPEGAAAPPAKRADPAPYVAPRPPIPLPMPLPAAPAPGTGSDSQAGASAVDGPGTGAGGSGTGIGSGRSGSGTGGTVIVPARLIAGAIGNRDFRKLPAALRTEGYVKLTITVDPAGRAANCAVAISSGNPALDAQTCVWVKERARYTPATIGGTPTVARMSWEQRYCRNAGPCVL